MIRTQVLGSEKDPAGFTHLRLARPPSFHYSPGQYVSLVYKEGEKARLLAIASHHTESELLFITKGDAVVRDTVLLSEAQGAGFACDVREKKPFLFLTHGTGISAIRPAMIERRNPEFHEDTLLYGVQADHLEPTLDCLEAAFGVRQLRAFSNAEYKAYVQDLIQTLDLDHFGTILLVGSQEMMVNCREILAAKKFPKERIFSNY